MTVYEKTKHALERADKLGGKTATNCIAEIEGSALAQAENLMPINRRTVIPYGVHLYL